MHPSHAEAARESACPTVGSWLPVAVRALTEAGVDSPRLEAEVLAAHSLAMSRSWVLAHPEAAVDEAVLSGLLARRLRREPLAYILGTKEFYGRSFAVGPEVLIPRPETEVVLEACLAALSSFAAPRVLDVGTGSGCLAVSLALERPGSQVTAVDLSEAALEVARRNAASLGAGIEFVFSDLLAGVAGREFDLVVSNPPYIERGTPLMPEVGLYEPALALYSGEGGLAVYRALAEQAHACLPRSGFLVVEFGDGLYPRASELIQSLGWEEVEVRKDLAGTPRAGVFSRTSLGKP